MKRTTSPRTKALYHTAQTNYERFHGIPRGCCTLEQVMASAAGVLGWAQFTGPGIKFEVPPISNTMPLREMQRQRKTKKDTKTKDKCSNRKQLQDESGALPFTTDANFKNNCTLPIQDSASRPTLPSDLPGDNFATPQLKGQKEIENKIEHDIEIALKASLHDDHASQKHVLANHMLNQLHRIQQPNGTSFKLCQRDINGDGFCFFRCIAEQTNLSTADDVYMHLLAACAFMEVARNKERLIDDDNNEKTERQTAMQQIPEYQYAMNNGLLDSFDIHILDQMEGVLKRDLSNTRRYASLTDIVALLKHFRLTCMLLQPHKWKTSPKMANLFARHHE